jgi:hypothetical protein
MIVAKLTAVTGLALFLAGVVGAGGSLALASGCLLLLAAAVIGAVILEGRDLEPAAALLYGIATPDEELDDEPGVAAVSPVAEIPTAA